MHRPRRAHRRGGGHGAPGRRRRRCGADRRGRRDARRGRAGAGRGRAKSTCHVRVARRLRSQVMHPRSLQSLGSRPAARVFLAYWSATREPNPTMSYAIISLGGKQYRVREGERLSSTASRQDGKTFTRTCCSSAAAARRAHPEGRHRHGEGDRSAAGDRKSGSASTRSAPGTSKHNGFRAALTQIEIESIGAKTAPRGAEGRAGGGGRRAEARAARAAAKAEERRCRGEAAEPAPGEESRWRTRRVSAPRRTVATPNRSGSGEDLRGPGGQGRDDHRAPAWYEVPSRAPVPASAATTRSSRCARASWSSAAAARSASSWSTRPPVSAGDRARATSTPSSGSAPGGGDGYVFHDRRAVFVKAGRGGDGGLSFRYTLCPAKRSNRLAWTVRC